MNNQAILGNSIYATRTDKFIGIDAVNSDKEAFIKRAYDKYKKNTKEDVVSYEKWVKLETGGVAAGKKYDANQRLAANLKKTAGTIKEVSDTIKPYIKTKGSVDEPVADEASDDTGGEKLILGMKPLTFGIVAVAVIGGAIGAYLLLKPSATTQV